jgi:serine/threonine-protein kinase RsbW
MMRTATQLGQEQAYNQGLLRLPASWARAFPGTPVNAGPARRFVAGLLDGSPFGEDAAVVLSELFTNALLHTASGQPGGLVIVQVTRWRHGVRIAVTDQGSSAEPVISDPASAEVPAESGHGLYLAAHLAQRLDWHDDASGRTVAAVLGQPLPTPSGPLPARRGTTSIPVGAIGPAGR